MRTPRIITSILLLFLAVAATAAGAEQTVFGPAKYDVKDRYGKKNHYSAAVPAAPGLYVIRIMNGEQPAERPDYVGVAVNGRKILIDDRYPFRYVASFIELAKENTLEVDMRDEQPAGFRRAPATPKNIVVTVLPAPPSMKSLRGTFGMGSWEALKDVADGFLRIKDPAAAQLAMDSVSLHLSSGERAAAVRKLSDLKEKTAEDFLLRLFNDPNTASDVRAEVCLALAAFGDKKLIPLLTRTVLDPDDRVSTAAARGLSFYPEEDTQAELTKVLEALDHMRKNAAIRTIADSGWKPVNTIIGLADSTDPHIANIAVAFLGSMREPRATDHLIKILNAPGKQDVRLVVRALGATGDPRATEALLAHAADPVKRRGLEVELADAFVVLGDKRAERPIVDMIKHPPYPAAEGKLKNAYRRLMGKEY